MSPTPLSHIYPLTIQVHLLNKLFSAPKICEFYTCNSLRYSHSKTLICIITKMPSIGLGRLAMLYETQ